MSYKQLNMYNKKISIKGFKFSWHGDFFLYAV